MDDQNERFQQAPKLKINWTYSDEPKKNQKR